MESMQPVDCEQLLTSAAGGDTASFASLYDALAPRVLGLCTQILRERAQAEEVMQEVFVEVWRRAAEFDASRGSAQSWVLRLARLRAIDRLRSYRAAQGRDHADYQLQNATWSASVEDEAVASLEAAQLRAAVDSIGEPHRTAVMLAYFHGFTHKELAENLEIPLGTAKTRVRDGLRKLRAIMNTKGAAR
ncbi:sigma-70 family RNA polymerase sigma factor [Corynebacterium sp.]|uniref:sigma-70 family RNA polymerase sigma factor n=1 Tax=Corynebacterium sp. TaxID=1720 RepID=UPI0026DDCB2B|nr:sigma-70 family RNA polymerase sigma factor [Corynebacterium sp.]MDO5077657.1 sigma-70 family RNA polymerase sigma factor [Corynebacterium sp.]